MAEQLTIGFYADTDIKALLEQWADEEDRSVSSVLRRLVEAERIRRAQPQAEEATADIIPATTAS